MLMENWTVPQLKPPMVSYYCWIFARWTFWDSEYLQLELFGMHNIYFLINGKLCMASSFYIYFWLITKHFWKLYVPNLLCTRFLHSYHVSKGGKPSICLLSVKDHQIILISKMAIKFQRVDVEFITFKSSSYKYFRNVFFSATFWNS